MLTLNSPEMAVPGSAPEARVPALLARVSPPVTRAGLVEQARTPVADARSPPAPVLG